MSQFPYRFFDEYVVRTPLFPHSLFREKFNQNEISEADLKNICFDTTFQEALYLASPDLYHEMNSWLDSEKKLSSSQQEKLKNTISKYYTRMSTRCTPFGLFSGVGLGKFYKTENEKTENIQLRSRDTKLDMHFLVSLAKHFENIPSIKTSILFFPNNSIYKIGKKIRYVEYEYTNGKRDYIISSAPLSLELQETVNFSKQGKTIAQITEILVSDETNETEAQDFIQELIDNQVLVSELEPNVSGKDFLDLLISVLSRIKATEEAEILTSVKEKLNQLDQHIGNPISLYEEIESLIKSFNTEYEQKFLFQTDLYDNNEFVLDSYWKKEIKKSVRFLNKITQPIPYSHIQKFKKAFYERFEHQEMPLSYVLDTEIGIGYKQNTSTKGIHSYLENLAIPVSRDRKNFNLELTPFHKILNEKIQDALLENHLVIELYDEDLKDFDEKWNDLPDTISLMAEIVSENNQEKLYIGSAGGNSAANLTARFCSEKSNVQNLTQQITKKEKLIREARMEITKF